MSNIQIYRSRPVTSVAIAANVLTGECIISCSIGGDYLPLEKENGKVFVCGGETFVLFDDRGVRRDFCAV